MLKTTGQNQGRAPIDNRTPTQMNEAVTAATTAQETGLKLQTEAFVNQNEKMFQDRAGTMLRESLQSKDPRVVRNARSTVRIMENQMAQVDGSGKDPLQKFMESTVQGNLGQLIPTAVDIVKIMYPQLVAHHITDIQPIDRPNGSIFVVNPVYNNSYKVTTYSYDAEADKVTSKTDDLQNKTVFRTYTDGAYASENIFGLYNVADADSATPASQVISDTIAFTVVQNDQDGKFLPAMGGTAQLNFYVVMSGVTYRIVMQDVTGNGNLTLTSAFDATNQAVSAAILAQLQSKVSSATVSNKAGVAISIKFTDKLVPATLNNEKGSVLDLNNIYFTAMFDYENLPQGIRSLDLQLQNKPVEATAKPLNIKWSVAAQLAAQASLDINLPDVLSNLIASAIKQERDVAVIRTVLANSTFDPLLVYDATPPQNYSKLARYAEFATKIDVAETQIQTAMGRGGLSYILCGGNVANIVRQIDGFEEISNPSPIGPHMIGTLRDGNVAVIKATFIDPNTYVLGFKGYVVGDSSIVLAEFVPLYMSGIFNAPTLQQSQGMMSMYDLKVNQAGYLKRGKIINYQG